MFEVTRKDGKPYNDVVFLKKASELFFRIFELKMQTYCNESRDGLAEDGLQYHYHKQAVI
jgi:hypothetical protein